MIGPDDEVTKARILLVDDEEDIRRIVERHLRQAGFRDIVTVSGPDGVVDAYIRERADLLLIDYKLPPTDGLTLMEECRKHDIDNVHPPVIMITGSGDDSVKNRALEAGVADFLPKSFEPIELVLRVRNALRTHQLFLEVQRQKTWLEEVVRRRTVELKQARKEVLERLAIAIEYRDDSTGEHTRRVGELSSLVAGALGSSPEFAQGIATAALLHDVGKIAVPDDVLLKPGELTSLEREKMERHSLLGAQMLAGSGEPVLAMACEIALSHHEWWDGTGYPHGLRGSEIPLCGRIVGVVDAFDAMLHDRPYRKSLSIDEALAQLIKGRGTQFDPQVVDALLIVVRAQRGTNP